MEQEKWVRTKWNGLFLISSWGRVYSLRRKKFIKPSLNNKGYYMVNLGVKMTKYVHRLVAEHFLNEIPGYVVDHIDSNKLNNHYSNLRWVTHSENVRKAYQVGEIPSREDIYNPNYKNGKYVRS